MQVEGYEVWLIIGLVLGVIWGNISLLKYSAKFDSFSLKGKKPTAKKAPSTENTKPSEDDDTPPAQ